VFGPSPSARLGFGLRLTDENHGTLGRSVFTSRNPSHPMRSVSLAAYLEGSVFGCHLFSHLVLIL
jgi:hypothetical protein